MRLGILAAGIFLGGCSTCSKSESPDAGPRCGNTGLLCLDQCVDPRTDDQNCGGCSIACPAATQCDGTGHCGTTCAATTTRCSLPDGGLRGCFDLTADPNNCGACSHGCAAGEGCVLGQCQTTCDGGGGILCSGACVNPRTDNQNCGGCGTSCSASMHCDGAGHCALGCAAPSTFCPEQDAGSGTCVDLGSNPANCGACGHACAQAEACVAGLCQLTCAGGTGVACGSQCVDPRVDAANCGRCGLACTGGATCVAGVCTATACQGRLGIPGPQVVAGGFGEVALVADLNRDGCPDVVLGASRTGPGGITVLLGDRAGGFQPPALYDSPSFYANGLAGGDLLGNGNPDVVTVAWGPAGPVHILLNRAGDGLLEPPMAFDAGPGGLGVAIGDINEDGHADIVLAAGNLGVSILWGDGSGSFTGPAVYPVPLFADGVAIADLNNDGHPDIVAGTTGAISVMLGIGDGGFSSAVSYVGGGEAIVPYDLNGDGLLDIVAASPLALGDEVDIFWNVGNGTLSGPTRNVFVPVDAVMGLGVSDLNGDGRPDIAASLLNSGARILRNLGDGGFAQDQYLVLGDSHFAALGLAKFTGGALADIFLSSSYASSSVLLPNDGHGAFPLPLPLLSSGPNALAVADVDGDGRPDVITPGSVFFNDAGFPSTRVDFAFPSSVSNIAVGDLDGDGRPDIVAGGAEVYVALNDAGTFPLVIAYPPAVSSISAVALGDFNGDGKIDVAATGATEGLISVLVNDGSGHLLAAATFDAGAAPTGMVVVDANGDGKLDLATVNSTGNTVAVLLGSGDGRFGPPTFYSVGSAPHAIAVGDVNGDGLPDLVVGNSSSANVSILLNSGAGLKPATTLSVGVTAESVQVTDINGDGKADIAVGGIESSSLFPVVVLFLGQSSGAFERRDYAVGTPGNVPSCSPPTGNLTFADFNADGRPDVAMTCAFGIGVQLTSCRR